MSTTEIVLEEIHEEAVTIAKTGNVVRIHCESSEVSEAFFEWLSSGQVDRDYKRLHFLLGQFQMHSPKMDSNHSWRFRDSGWPMQFFVGHDVQTAIDNVIQHSTEGRDAERCVR